MINQSWQKHNKMAIKKLPGCNVSAGFPARVNRLTVIDMTSHWSLGNKTDESGTQTRRWVAMQVGQLGPSWSLCWSTRQLIGHLRAPVFQNLRGAEMSKHSVHWSAPVCYTEYHIIRDQAHKILFSWYPCVGQLFSSNAFCLVIHKFQAMSV